MLRDRSTADLPLNIKCCNRDEEQGRFLSNTDIYQSAGKFNYPALTGGVFFLDYSASRLVVSLAYAMGHALAP